MKPPRAPRLETRRAKELEAELVERARAWIPSWGTADDERDFGRALIKIAARFGSEVAERLDRGGEKMRLGFLDWLAVPAEAARPARLPVVFKLADSARDPVLATESTRLQVEALGAPVILETEKDVYLLPGQLKALVGVDADGDAFYLPPPGISSLAPLEPLPTRWQLKSFASTGAAKLQLDPELGLAKDMLVEIGGQQYRIEKVEKDIVTLDPPLTADQPERAIVSKVDAFSPFDGARNQQQHVLYLGHKELFDVDAAASIEVVGAEKLAGVAWEYWGKNTSQGDEVRWWPLPPAKNQAMPDAVALAKPKGSMETLELAPGAESRWIRAVAGSLKPSDQPVRADAFEIRINCLHGSPPPPKTPEAAPTAEGMANTTPLVLESVLDSVFFPLGKEPRQFDAFYLGSKEAFSKKGAVVDLDFQLADTTFSALTAVRTVNFANGVLAGVAQDGALHLLSTNPPTAPIGKFLDRDGLHPPPPDGNTDPSAGVVLDRRPRGRLPQWHDAQDPQGFLTAATAGSAVWVWRENSADKNASRWISFGTVPALLGNEAAPVSDLIFLDDTSTLIALRGGQLSSRKWPDGAAWTPIDTKAGPNSVVLDALVPVLTELGGSLVTSAAAGMVGVSRGGKLYEVSPAGACTVLSPSDVGSSVRPVAVRRGGDLIVALAHTSLRDLAMFHSAHGEAAIGLEPDAVALGFTAVLSGGDLYFLASVRFGAGGYLASWVPQNGPGNSIEVFRSSIPAGAGQCDGAPTVIGPRVVVPGSRGDLLTTDFDLSRRLSRHGDVSQCVFSTSPTPTFKVNDLVARTNSATGAFASHLITEAGTTPDGTFFYLLDGPFPSEAADALYGFRLTDFPSIGDLTVADGRLTLDPGDHTTHKDTLVVFGGIVYRVADEATAGSVPLDPPPVGADMPGVAYWNSTVITGRAAPFMQLNAANRDWDIAFLDHGTLVFAGAPPAQRGTAFRLDATNRPVLIELSSPWGTPPGPGINAAFTIDGAAGTWTRSLGDAATNPQLSWEYWNGTGWWKLEPHDETLQLKNSGRLTFKVPSDLSPTDWSGRTNYWIRARLIGGDYGRESVSVTTSPPDPITHETHQTVVRSTKDIHAPSVVKLGISYKICEKVRPTFVLTKDSGSLRDQSDANRTPGAKVETFVSVAAGLGRLSGPDVATVAPEECPPECDCPSSGSAAQPAPASNAAAAQSPAADTFPVSGRALYLGFDAALSGEPVNVLLLVEERAHNGFAPMKVEALIADRFMPIVVNDTTRALGESGVLSMAFPLQPTPRELFGHTLAWLRLTPAAGNGAGGWKPKVLGAYLNAVWASAAETLTYELVGSSQGEPHLTLYLARPPVLQGTLQLRVKEPLGEEEREQLNAHEPLGEAERQQLNAQEAHRVLSAVETLPGDWVLWKRVVDPADELPTARVYALDEGTGEIRFGDGRFGKIPPVGRNSIMAFKYRRTETGGPDSAVVPANAITARTALNLVSPVKGVEAVFAADQAAGGAPAESTDRVLRFGVAGIRHRKRALTARDIEDLALQSSPDIAQARCFLRNSFVHLVVVMRGADPIPNAGQVRELQRLLLDASPPSLSAPRALRIGRPAIRRLRVDLRLRVASLDDAGAVARDAKRQIIALFDTVTGGPDENGWELGANPTEGDIAMALADVGRLDGIADVALREITAEGADRPWPVSLEPTELAMLHKDVMRAEFKTVEVIA
jgi:hypothetical protein